MEDIRRVFFHELGHVVANEINRVRYGGLGTRYVFLYPCKGNSLIYCGATKPNKPQGVNNGPPPWDRLAQSLLSSVYGCIFQSYCQKKSSTSCFSINGIDDISYWDGYLTANKVPNLRPKLAMCDDQYFAELIKKKSLDGFMSIKHEDFLSNRFGNLFRVDLEKLLATIAPLIKEHACDYAGQKERYERILNGGK